VKNEFFTDPQALDKITARIKEENPDAYFTDQLANPANPPSMELEPLGFCLPGEAEGVAPEVDIAWAGREPDAAGFHRRGRGRRRQLAMTNPLSSGPEKYKQGKLLRARTPRELHGDLHGPLERDSVAVLAESDKSRVPELLPERYRRMMVDPFAFLRGAAAVMATDLAHQPVAGTRVQACRDCHLMNFGAFTTPEDNILFDINDFDETLPGVDFTVDVKRLAASLAVAAKAAGLSDKRARSLAAGAVAAYRDHMFGLMELSSLEIWHSRIDFEEEVERIGDPQLRRSLSTLIAKARSGGLETDDNFPHLVTVPNRGSRTGHRRFFISVRMQTRDIGSTPPARSNHTEQVSPPIG
jgi:hypothetical protein